MAPRRFFDHRLALRLYLVGLLQFVAVAAGFALLVFATRAPLRAPIEVEAREVAATLAASLDDDASLQAELEALRRRDVKLSLYTDEGGLVVATEEPAFRCGPERGWPMAPPPPRGHRPPPPRLDAELGFGPPRGRPPGGTPPHHCAIVPVSSPRGSGLIHYAAPIPSAWPSLALRVVPLVLLVVGASTFLLARSIARPLERVARAARAFGEGHSEARTGVRRDDEIGDVARAVDDMADRVTTTLRSERELLANVSHELRTPLARIRVALDLAEEGDAEAAREALGDICSDLAELEQIIDGVLAVARLDLGDPRRGGGLPSLRADEVGVAALVEQAVARLRAAQPSRPVELELACGDAMVTGDPVLLRRALDNLLDNAHKYTERRDAPIRVRAQAGERVELSVVDTGVGIAPEDRAQLFRPFFRADRSRARATGGLGLGLALAQRIVAAHGGELDVESELGRGTTARIVLPLARPERASTPGDENAGSS